ncbi:hypothetical protein F5884DRAFT_861743 [Xylogone sp. PMI_703]|nr:hypothetical protein F5884DRAFT_861743 [Xylogone sp. PMI_703]
MIIPKSSLVQIDPTTAFAIYQQPSGGLIVFKAAALGSVACMVNVNGYLQLGFLGMLIYSSVAELWLAVLARELQMAAYEYQVLCSARDVKGNDKKYKGIIQAALGLDEDHRLDVSSWIELKLLPDLPLFRAVLHTLQTSNNQSAKEDILDGVRDEFNSRCGRRGTGDTETKERIWREIERVWNEHTGNTEKLNLGRITIEVKH